jgi:chromobox protein 1
MGAAKQKPDSAEPKRRRKSQPSATDTASTAGTVASQDDVPDWVPKKVKDWESYVVGVDTIIRDPETQSLIAYLHWTNGKKSKVSISTCYDKCPRKASYLYPF